MPRKDNEVANVIRSIVLRKEDNEVVNKRSGQLSSKDLYHVQMYADQYGEYNLGPHQYKDAILPV